MSKAIIYYTDNRLQEPIFSIVQKQILLSGVPVRSVSLAPIDFGTNIVVDAKPSIFTMMKQILAGLEASNAETIFFCEHDVLYHPSHFDFSPTEDLFYYNINVWKWPYPDDRLVTYDHLVSLSGLCAKRDLLLSAFRGRMRLILQKGWDKESGREPHWARRMGYEPGTKSQRQKIFKNEYTQYWRSPLPNIDIRHGKTLTRTKCRPEDFKHPPNPDSWKEKKLDELEGWDLKKCSSSPVLIYSHDIFLRSISK